MLVLAVSANFWIWRLDLFLEAELLYKPLCPSVGLLVGWQLISAHPEVAYAKYVRTIVEKNIRLRLVFRSNFNFAKKQEF